MLRRSRWLTLLAALAALLTVVVTAGCGSEDKTSGAADQSASSSGEGTGAGTRLRIILVGAAPPSEPFASVSAKGLEQAGEDFNLETIWRGPAQPNPSDPTEQGRLIENAIASNPDGLIISDVYPRQFNPLIRSAVDKGIPVMLFSAGVDEVEETGALGFVGNDEFASGRLAGEEMDGLGARHPLVVALTRGIPSLDARVDGFRDGFPGDVTVLEVPMKDINDTTKVRNLIEVELQKDSSIDAVWPIGTGLGAPVLAAYDALGEKARQMKWGQLGLDGPTINALKQEQYSFSTDQQQFLQGYLPAMWLSFYARYGMRPVDPFIRTGPSIVTPEDADQLIDLSAKKIR